MLREQIAQVFLAAVLCLTCISPLQAQPDALKAEIDGNLEFLNSGPVKGQCRSYLLLNGQVYFVGCLDPGKEKTGRTFFLYRVENAGKTCTPLLEIPDRGDGVSTSTLTPVSGIIGSAASRRIAILQSADAGCPPRGIRTRMLTYDLDTKTLSVPVDNGRYNFNPVFSPDGTKIAFLSIYAEWWSTYLAGPGKGYSLHVADLSTGKTRQLAPPSVLDPNSFLPAWSPDGKYIAFAARYPTKPRKDWNPIYIVSVEGKTSRTLEVSNRYWTGEIVWPELDRLLCHVESPSAESGPGIYSADLGSGRPDMFFRAPRGVDNLRLMPDGRHIAFTETAQDGHLVERILGMDGKDTTEPLPPLGHFDGTWTRGRY